MGLMSLAGLEPKSGSRHMCLIIAWTGQQVPVLCKGVKGVNDAARLPEGGGLLALSLPLVSIPCPAQMPNGPANAR